MTPRPLEGPGSETRLANLQRRFRNQTRRLGRPLVVRRILDRWAPRLLVASAAALAFCLYLLASGLSTVGDAIKHLAAAPNCTAARAVGLGEAHLGEPGYWRRHDRDQDGVACEPWPR